MRFDCLAWQQKASHPEPREAEPRDARIYSAVGLSGVRGYSRCVARDRPYPSLASQTNMNSPLAMKAKGVAWLVLSPIAVLVALVSTVQSQTAYYVQVVAFGAWSILGMISGVASLEGAKWAHSIKRVLALVAISYFAVAGIAIASFLAAALLNGGVANPAHGWGLTGLVLLLVLSAMVRARTRKK